MPRRYSPDEKSAILAQFREQSGSAAEFCRARGLSYQTFLNWRRAVGRTAIGVNLKIGGQLIQLHALKWAPGSFHARASRDFRTIGKQMPQRKPRRKDADQ